MLKILNLLKNTSKNYYSIYRSVSNINLEHLNSRSLLKVSGEEVSEYLQGLITNDINHVENGPTSLFTLFLNSKGRILCDALIYKTHEDKTFLIECDKDIMETLEKHLKIYRIRRKINIDHRIDLNVFVLYSVSAETPININEIKYKENNLMCFRDPRTVELGLRIISSENVLKQKLDRELNTKFNLDNSKTYKTLRYSLGIGEGIKELPPGDCFPLEANGDYLHGISFHKGCYIGQELTARTYHTGVIRKRLMPLIFTKIPTVIPEDNKLMCGNANIGKFRGIENDLGLGLLRIDQALNCENITVGNGLAKTFKPMWWPLEAPKSMQKADT